MLTVRFALAWTLINLAGIAAFLIVAAQFWVEPEIEQLPGFNIGDAIGWFLFAAPIAFFFAIGNLTMLFSALQSQHARSWWRPFLFFALILAGWGAAWLVDNAHHGI